MSERVVINVGGRRYETRVATLQRFPGSLLGEPRKCQPYYNPDSGEYFFDRSGSSFEGVLQYYQTDGAILQRPPTVALEVFVDDLQFYGLGDAALRRVQRQEGVLAEDGQAAGPGWRARLWTWLEYPGCALPFTLVSAGVTLLSILAFVLETLPQLGESVYALAVVQLVCTVWFLLELLARLVAACPHRTRLFILDPLNYVDLLAILPCFIGVALRGVSPYRAILSLEGIGKLARVLRLFRYVRHTAPARVLRQTVLFAAPTLAFSLLIFCMAVVIFGSLVFWAEYDVSSSHTVSILDGLWWAVVTITTVGYGDIVPFTPVGKVIGGLCASFGVLNLALPLATIVSWYLHFSQANRPVDTRRTIATAAKQAQPARS